MEGYGSVIRSFAESGAGPLVAEGLNGWMRGRHMLFWFSYIAVAVVGHVVFYVSLAALPNLDV